MFEDLVVSAPPAGRFGTRAAVLPLSVAAHAVALAAALLLPALTPPELPPPPVPDLVVDWVSAPPTPPPVIATPAPARLTKAPPSHDSARAAVADPVAPPPAPGPTVSMIDPTAVLPEDGRAPCLFNCAGSTPDGNSDGPRGGTPGPGADEGTGGGPIRPGGDIKPPVRTVYVAPPYPDLARAARIQGLVVIECTIDPSGRVVDARVITGHPLLQNAALDAVRQWRYKATRLNGVPVAVLMTVTVNFSLGR
jgi:protein TonB